MTDLRNLKNLAALSGEVNTEQVIESLKADQGVWAALTRANIDETVIPKNIVATLDFKDSFLACRQCLALEQCQSPFHHLSLELVNNAGVLERVFHDCRLKKAALKSSLKFVNFDFPSTWHNVTLTQSENRIDINKTRLPFITAATELLKGNPRWIYLTGKQLLGKSYLAAALANEIFEFNPKVMYINTNRRFKEINDLNFTNKEQFNRVIEELANVDFLILDDFGNEYKSDFVRDTILFPLLSARARNKKVTIFTSDFTIAQIGAMYATSSAAKPRAEQLVDLLTTLTGGEIKLTGIAVY